jgi:hypothetical protein
MRTFVPVASTSAGVFQIVTVGRTTTVSSIVLFGTAGATFEMGGRDSCRHPVASQRAMGRAYSDWRTEATEIEENLFPSLPIWKQPKLDRRG